MDGPHPQLGELERRIAWFIDHPEFEQCVVVEPASGSVVRFHIPLKSKRRFREAKLGRVMEVELTPGEAVDGEDVMLAMGFESLTQRRATFDGKRNRVFPHFTKPATRAKDAAKDVMKIMEDVFALGDSPWLWTFHVDDPDQWPDPLPKPDPWPPAG